MISKTMTYTDYDGNQRTETFRFNLNQAEVTEMEVSTDGGLVAKIEKITAAQDGAEIMKLFKEIILKAYGEKSDDGKHFVKSEAISTAFSQTEAYNDLFMLLTTDPNEAAAFISGIVPQPKK